MRALPSLSFLAASVIAALALCSPAARAGTQCEVQSFQIFFGAGLSTMTAAGQDTADAVVDYLASCSANLVHVSGHSDGAEATGPVPGVSLARAKTVYDYLLSRGVSAAVMDTIDDGFSAPMVQSDPTASEPLNRFVKVDIN